MTVDAVTEPPPGRTPTRVNAVDIVLTILIAVFQVGGTAMASMHNPHGRPFDVVGAVVLLLAALPVLWRRRWPNAMLLASFAGTLLYSLLGYGFGPVWLGLIATFVTAAIMGRRLWTYATLAAGVVFFGFAVDLIFDRPGSEPIYGLFAGAWMLVLAAIGEVVRYRRALTAAERARVAAAAGMRAEEWERRSAEERLEIARDLHDVLGHSLSAINVQASAGLQLLTTDPDRAAEAMTAIRSASRDALLEMQGFLDSLRRTGDSAPRRPAPTLADLDALVSRARETGATVRTTVDGPERKLTAGVDLAASRIIQEALTNVIRHAGPGDASVRVTYGETGVDLRIDNSRATRPAGEGPALTGGGRGIPGMRHRVEALGGTLTAGRKADGGWSVSAHIPYPGGSS